MYTIRLLGGIGIEGPQGPVNGHLPQRRPLAVLAALALAGPCGCSRAKLAGLLWPDDDETKARHHLSDALSRVRQVLGASVLLADGDILRPNDREFRSDVDAFEEAYRQGRLDDAIRLYRGPLLDGFYLGGAGAFEEFVGRERDRLAAEYASALERLAHIAATAGHHRAAADWLRMLVAHDPYNSRIVLKLVAALEESGDRPNALRAIDEHDRRLRAELELEPDPAVVRTLQRLRACPASAAAQPGGKPYVAPVPRPVVMRAARLVPRPGARPAAAIVTATCMLAGWFVLRAAMRPTPDPDHWLVMPFTVVGEAPALRRLAIDLPTMAEMHLPAPPGPHVHERAAARARWAAAHGTIAAGLPEDRVLAVARDLDDGRAVLGTLGEEAGRVTMVVRLLAVPTGDHRGVGIGSAPPESTAVLLARLLDDLRRQDAALSRTTASP